MITLLIPAGLLKAALGAQKALLLHHAAAVQRCCFHSYSALAVLVIEVSHIRLLIPAQQMNTANGAQKALLLHHAAAVHSCCFHSYTPLAVPAAKLKHTQFAHTCSAHEGSSGGAGGAAAASCWWHHLAVHCGTWMSKLLAGQAGAAAEAVCRSSIRSQQQKRYWPN
jgi:hypothetical protein